MHFEYKSFAFRFLGNDIVLMSAYDDVWVLPYIPVHQQCQSQLIDSFTEMIKKNTFKLFLLIYRSQNMQKKSF